MKKITFFKKRDALIILAILIIGIAGMTLPRFFSGNVIAEISFNGMISKQVELSKDAEFEFNNIRFEVKNGAIRVVDSPCHDKICVRTGFISSPAQVIVCLPQQLVVKIINGKNDVDITVG